MQGLECRNQHHISICTNNTNVEVKSVHTLTVEGSTSLPLSQTSCNPSRESNGRPIVLYVNASTPILLPTAKAAIYISDQPTEKFLVCLSLNSGSQRSYVTTRVIKREAKVQVRESRLSVKTFGSTEENTQLWMLFACVSVLSTKMTCSSLHLLYHSSAILYRANPLCMAVLLMHT